jgi:hypothetical protein
MLDTNPDLAAEISDGDALTVLTVARQFDVSPSTAFRWIMRGLANGRGDRVRLAAIRRGKVWVTSRAALKRFFAALPASTTPPTAPAIRAPAKRHADCERAQKNLVDKYGI